MGTDTLALLLNLLERGLLTLSLLALLGLNELILATIVLLQSKKAKLSGSGSLHCRWYSMCCVQHGNAFVG